MEEWWMTEGFIFKPSDDKKEASSSTRQRGPALHQTLVSFHDHL